MAVTDARERRLIELRKEVTQRGFDRHASLLKNVSELPVELQSPAVSALAARETIQTIVLFPQQLQRGWEYVPKQALLFTATGLIHLFASIWPDQEPQITHMERCDLLYIRIKLILLYGSLEIVAQGENAPVRLSMEFNTVAWYYLSSPLQRFLQMVHSEPDTSRNKGAHSIATQQTLKSLPLKFANGLEIFGLLPGEELEGAVFQPGVWQRRLYFFQQPILANTLLLLTSHYVVAIQEELNIRQGWIVSYIPQNSIDDIQNGPCDLGSELSFRLKPANHSADYKLILKSEVTESWRSLWTQHGLQWYDQQCA